MHFRFYLNKLVKQSKKNYSKNQKLLWFLIWGFVFVVLIPFIIVLCSLFIDTKLNLPKLLPELFNLIIALFFIILGLLLIGWTGFVQFNIGKGTPIPAMPTQRLITTSVYSLCRNPMLLGTLIYYLWISLWINSLSAIFLTTLFFLFSTAYIKLVEEKELEARFGKEYKEYKRKTPFLIPKIWKIKQFQI